MASLGAKLVGMDAVPATLHYADGGQDGPLELRHVQVEEGSNGDEDTVQAVIHVQAGGTQSLARITGGVDADELALQIPTEPREFDSVEAFLAADDIFETAKTVVDVTTDL
ncbi:hypothetical protein [Halobacterium jilantaiense]|uniref:Uncharacterized protein n=1 Tax=Halobacterium jilantaiense TaxID=355548 RepID=A0A1I0NGG6_9EURY|nr:hypothetical protein [Halobacterium jilantaiense]SEW00588.1 hypothetical protein SAMN04487945_0864 [Halobacterium jilantaiense]